MILAKNNLILEYHEVKIDAKKIIVVDKLVLSFLAVLPTQRIHKGDLVLNKNCYLKLTDLTDRKFKSVYNLFLDSHLIGKIKAHPQELYMDSDLIHMQFENCQLYSYDYLNHIRYMINVLNFKFKQIVTLDIAIDCTEHALLLFVDKAIKSDHIIMKGKGKIYPIYGNKSKTLETVYFGRPTSEKQIKIYNKSLELILNDKPYIKYFWESNQINYNEEIVERLELTLKNRYLKNINVFALNDCDYLASILELHFKNFFAFKSTYREHNKTVTKSVTPINLSGFKTTKLQKPVTERKNTTLPIKIEIKRLYLSFLNEELLRKLNEDTFTENQNMLSMRGQNGFINSIMRLLELNPELRQYYSNRKKQWHKEFENFDSIYDKIAI
jgi:hypothetical protein